MSYPGGKAGPGVFHRIISLMPPHEIYIEPFMGGFSIGRLKRPAKLNIGIDVDRAAVQMAFLFCQARWRAEYPVDEKDASEARSPHAETQEPRPQEAPEAASADPLSRTFEASGSRWQFFEYDGIVYLETMARCNWHFGKQPDGTLIYCDPPYMRHTCASRCRYKHDMTDPEHRRLLRALQDLNALPEPPMLMISGYDSDLYRQTLMPISGTGQPWTHITFQTMTRGGTKATEHLWFNFAPPTVLHDYRYVGTNFRDRERIKRAQTTWVRKLKRLKPYEREALLAAIAETASAGDASRNVLS